MASEMSPIGYYGPHTPLWDLRKEQHLEVRCGNCRHKGKMVGWVTSGGYAHYVDKSMAQGYVPKELATDTGKGAFEIEIISENRKATVSPTRRSIPKANACVRNTHRHPWV
jgi:glycine cleavage system aminomethyltransferase T